MNLVKAGPKTEKEGNFLKNKIVLLGHSEERKRILKNDGPGFSRE